ncbi:MAG: FeoB-associated Cys-rich membrane protein [Eubacterium sp.]|nr:FeoB-associated Cys-rich membrane protein [Eubacterium sp.]
MISWITENIGTIIITLLLILLVVVIIRSMVNHKKRGISSCGGNCAGCKACRNPVKSDDNDKQYDKEKMC